MEHTRPTSPQKGPVNPVLAATIMLLRDDRDALEVFMVQRHHQIDFATGALVFPGGKTDPADRDAALRPHCPGCERLDEEALALRVSAVRETFEECGVLVARERGKPTLLPESRVRPLETAHRADLLAGRYTMCNLVEQHQLELATDMLVPFAHWITPDFMPKRFDTWFYLVPAPEDQVAAHDGEESVDSVWVKPADAIAEARAGRRTIIFPTLNNLMKLARSRSVEEALERARTEPLISVLPTVHRTEAGKVLRIAPEAGYELNEVPMEGGAR